jgi:hypothetical protein
MHYSIIIVNILAGLFLINALFWGLFDHQLHCKVIQSMGIQCISHNYHLIMSVVFFVSTVLLIHRKHLNVPLIKNL